MFEQLKSSLTQHEKTLKKDIELRKKNNQDKRDIINQVRFSLTTLLNAILDRPDEMKFRQALDHLKLNPENFPHKYKPQEIEKKYVEFITDDEPQLIDFFARLLSDKSLKDDPSKTKENDLALLIRTLDALWLFYALSAAGVISSPAVESKIDVIAMRATEQGTSTIIALDSKGQTSDRLTAAETAQRKKLNPLKQRVWEIIDEKKINPFKAGWEELARQVFAVVDREMQVPPSTKTIIRYAKEKFNVKK